MPVPNDAERESVSGLMTRALMVAAVLLAGVMAVRRGLSAERRESLSRLPGAFMERCMEHMPEEAPPKVMMSSLRRIREQNEEVLGLLREQNDLMRAAPAARKGHSAAGGAA